MPRAINCSDLFAETQLFSQGIEAGEFIFLAQDSRGADGTLGAHRTAAEQARQTLANVAATLNRAGLSLDDLVALSVFIPQYADADDVAAVLRSTLPNQGPAVIFAGVCGLDGDCRVRMDVIATTSKEREAILISDLPMSIGARCHGIRVGDLFFLSGVDAAERDGRPDGQPAIQSQTKEVLTRMRRILDQQKLGLGNLCRTFMFIPGTQYRPGYGEARREIYQGIFSEDRFPPNSGIYIRDLGSDILLRSMAIAYRGKQTIVTSPKVRLAPGSFSQSARVGNWLWLAGQDAVTFDRAVEAEGSLSGQTRATLRHTRDIVEAAGGTLNDIVKTTVYLIEGLERAEFAAAYSEFFTTQTKSATMPAGLTVEVQELSPGCLVEIDSIAYLGKK